MPPSYTDPFQPRRPALNRTLAGPLSVRKTTMVLSASPCASRAFKTLPTFVSMLVIMA